MGVSVKTCLTASNKTFASWLSPWSASAAPTGSDKLYLHLASVNNTYVQVPFKTYPTESTELKLNGYDFSLIPTSSVITGVQITLDKLATLIGTAQVKDISVRWGYLSQSFTSGSTLNYGITSSNKAITGSYWPTSSIRHEYGSSTDMWGIASQSIDVDSFLNTFTVYVRCMVVSASSSTTASYAKIDFSRVTINYI